MTMQLQICGAAGEVTGSCYLLTVGDKKVLIDCGLIQGSPADEARNHAPFPFEVEEIDAVLLTHAHLDHCGRLPLLARRGYRGPIYSHDATAELCHVMLRDAAHIHEQEAGLHGRHPYGRRQGGTQPLYTMQDAEAALRLFTPFPYDSKRDILPGVALRLRDAGHILGAAIAELWLQHEGEKRKLVFSGDIGRAGAPLMREPTAITKADLVVMESTYGDRDHPSWQGGWDEVAAILQQAEWDHGNVLIPSFAVGRTQDLLYQFARHYDEWKLDRWQSFLDSPMAIEVTGIYSRHIKLYNPQAAEFWQRCDNSFMLPDLNVCRYAEESMVINDLHAGALIIAGSGMCEGGRIRHHLRHNLWRNHCHVIIVGYQVEGTLGRALVDGADSVELWGEEVEVNAQVHAIGGFSAHAGRRELLAWYNNFENRPPLLLLHGEEGARSALAQELGDNGVEVSTPGYGEVINL